MIPAKGRMKNCLIKIEPWGTPWVREAVGEENLLVLTEKVLSDKPG